MKELTSIEMANVSGAALKAFINGTQGFGAAVVDGVLGGLLSAIVCSSAGGLQGATTASGAGGGLIGVGVITMAVGSIWGAIHGGILGVCYGAYNGVAEAQVISNQVLDGMSDGTIGGYKPIQWFK